MTDQTSSAAADPQNSNTNTTANTTSPTVDVQAQISQALAAQQADFATQLEKVTGHKDLQGFADAQLKAQGKLQELADAKTAEANTYKTKYEQALVGNALLSASAEAVDPAIVKDLLAGKAKVDENGTVTIDGKSAADAVKALLTEKPFLAKAQGGTGSGSPQSTSTGKSKSRAEFEGLSAGDKASFMRDGGQVTA